MNLDHLLAQAASYPRLTKARELSLARRAAAGDARAQELLVLHNIPLAVWQANHWTIDGAALEDLVQHALIGLVKASRSYDPTKSAFGTYATWKMRGELSGRLRSRRRELERTGPRMDDRFETLLVDAPAEGPSPEGMALEAAQRDEVDQVLSYLPEREARALRLRHGLEGDPDGIASPGIARALGVDPTYARRLERQALSRLRAINPKHLEEAA